MTPLWDPIFGAEAITAELDDGAWIRAMLDVEAALARACARVGVLDSAAAETVVAACAGYDGSAAELGRRAAADGNPVIPLVRDLTARTGDAVHRGATSQDILDSAAMLVARRALAVLLTDLSAAADAGADLAHIHRSTPMAARSLLQQALPTTFGAMAAGWVSGLDSVTVRLREIRQHRLAVQFGGAAGTLASVYPHGLAIQAALAAELGLADPGGSWHAERTRIADLAGALGSASGAIGKVATDVVHLAQTEVGEVREASGGGSSTLPHKQNPVAAITARAAAAQAPGLVATLLSAMSAEYQRGAGPWHAEWEPLTALLRSTGGAAARLRQSLTGLQVDAARMRTNLDATSGLLLAERVTTALAPTLGRLAAHDLVRDVTTGPVPFADALREVAGIDPTELLDPAGYLGHATDVVDRLLASRSRERR